MRHPSATDDAERTIVSFPQPSRPPSLEAPEPGERFLGPSGLIWTVQAITACGNRIVLTTGHSGRRPADPGHSCSHRPEPVTRTSVDPARPGMTRSRPHRGGAVGSRTRHSAVGTRSKVGS